MQPVKFNYGSLINLITQAMKGLTNMYKTYFELSNDDAGDIEYFESEETARAWKNA